MDYKSSLVFVLLSLLLIIIFIRPNEAQNNRRSWHTEGSAAAAPIGAGPGVPLGIQVPGATGSPNGDLPQLPDASRSDSSTSSPQSAAWFKQLNQQVSAGNKIDQCPCVIRPGTDTCVTYDPTVQAATLSEAILNFQDLTIRNPSAGNPSRAIAGPKGLECTTDQCKACVAQFIDFMRQRGSLSEEYIEEVTETFGVPPSSLDASQLANCNRYSFSGRYRGGRRGGEGEGGGGGGGRGGGGKGPGSGRGPPPWRKGGEERSQEDSEDERQARQEFERLSQSRANGQNTDAWSRRGKRATNDTTTTNQFIGTRKIINCIKRGQPAQNGSDALALCSYCWAFRQLPDNYFPTFINELVCDQDTQCLSGWGECKQKLRSYSILQNFGTETAPNWKPTSVTAGSCCECQVQSGSPIESLIVGTNKTQT